MRRDNNCAHPPGPACSWAQRFTCVSRDGPSRDAPALPLIAAHSNWLAPTGTDGLDSPGTLRRAPYIKRVPIRQVVRSAEVYLREASVATRAHIEDDPADCISLSSTGPALPENGLPPVFDTIEELMSFMPFWVEWVKKHQPLVPDPETTAERAVLELWLNRSRLDLTIMPSLVFHALARRSVDAVRGVIRNTRLIAAVAHQEFHRDTEEELIRREEEELVPELVRWLLDAAPLLDEPEASIAAAMRRSIENGQDVNYTAIAREIGRNPCVVSRAVWDMFRKLAARREAQITDAMTYEEIVESLASAYRLARFSRV